MTVVKKDFIYWTPRVLSIAFICFLALFSLDVFDTPSPSVWMTIGGLLMHNIPVFILAVILALAWRWEIVGAAAFLSAGLLYIVTVAFSQGPLIALSWSLIIAGPAFLIGALFLVGWRRKRT